MHIELFLRELSWGLSHCFWNGRHVCCADLLFPPLVHPSIIFSRTIRSILSFGPSLFSDSGFSSWASQSQPVNWSRSSYECRILLFASSTKADHNFFTGLSYLCVPFVLLYCADCLLFLVDTIMIRLMIVHCRDHNYFHPSDWWSFPSGTAPLPCSILRHPIQFFRTLFIRDWAKYTVIFLYMTIRLCERLIWAFSVCLFVCSSFHPPSPPWRRFFHLFLS